jgi:hypothetical protein
VRGKGGESYAIVSDVAMKNARSTKETNPRWSWTDQKPKDWFLE